MGKKKIWIVTELFHPEETAVAYIFTRIADQLANDYDVRVICGPEFYDNNKVDYIDTYQLSSDIKVFRAKTLHLNKNSLIQRSLKIIVLGLNMSILVMKKVSKGEIVLLATNPAPLIVIMGLIKKWKKFQLHILVHDVFPENTIPAGVFKNNKSVLYKLFKELFDRSYAKADHLIVIGRDMKEVLINKTKRFRNKPSVSVVTNWSKPSGKSNVNINIASAPVIENKELITLQYAGNIGRTQALDILLDSFASANNPDIHLSIRGTGAMSAYIQNQIQVNNWQNVSLSGGYSRSDESTVLSQSDIAVVPLSPRMYGLGVPSKTYNLLAAGKPILFIGDPNSEISLMVQEYKIGWSIDVNNKVALIEFFSNLSPENKVDFQEKGQRARLLAETRFEEKTILAQFQRQMEINFKDK